LHGEPQVTGAFGAGEFCTVESQIPALPGAYLLLIEFTKVTDVKLRKLPGRKSGTGALSLRRFGLWTRRAQGQGLPPYATNQSGTVAH
jgi:hypothetical protein